MAVVTPSAVRMRESFKLTTKMDSTATPLTWTCREILVGTTMSPSFPDSKTEMLSTRDSGPSSPPPAAAAGIPRSCWNMRACFSSPWASKVSLFELALKHHAIPSSIWSQRRHVFPQPLNMLGQRPARRGNAENAQENIG